MRGKARQRIYLLLELWEGKMRLILLASVILVAAFEVEIVDYH